MHFGQVAITAVSESLIVVGQKGHCIVKDIVPCVIPGCHRMKRSGDVSTADTAVDLSLFLLSTTPPGANQLNFNEFLLIS
jgi:hypothetical protein